MMNSKNIRKSARYAILVLLGIYGLTSGVGVPFLPGVELTMASYVLLGIALLLVVTDLVSQRVKGAVFIVAQSARKFGFWLLVGLLLNSLTVELGLLAIRWAAAPSLGTFESLLQPGFEFLGIFGSLIFALFVVLGLISTVVLVFKLTGWSPVETNPEYIGGIGYKQQLASALILVGIGGVLASQSGSGIILVIALQFLVVPAAVGALAHIAAVAVRIFGRHPWRETVSEILWGVGLVVVIFSLLGGIEGAYLQISNLLFTVESQESIGRYFTLISNSGLWVAAFLLADTLVGALSIHMFNNRKWRFVEVVGADPYILRRLLRNTGLLLTLTFVLVAPSGVVATMIDVDFGALAIGAYGMILAITVSRVVELFFRTRMGVLVSSMVAWIGVGLFAALVLSNLPALVETVSNIPNLAGIAEGALPYALIAANASWWLIGGIAIVGFVKIARSIDIVAGRAGAPTLLAAVGFVGIGWMSWAVADAFSVIGPGFRLAGAIALGATFGGAISLLATLFVGTSGSVAPHFAGWLADSRFRAINIGGFVVVYILVLRSAIFDVFAYAMLIEWIAVALVTTYVARRTWMLGRALGERGNSEAPSAEWVSHSQTIDFVEDPALSKLLGEYSAFVNHDSRTALVTRLSTVMWASGKSYEEILLVVSQMLGVRAMNNAQRFRLIRKYLLLQNVDDSTYQSDTRESALNSIGIALEESANVPGSGSLRSDFDVLEMISKGEQVFIETSDQSQLVATYCVASWSDGADRSSIGKILDPLTRYERPAVPWYRFGPFRRGWDVVAREDRLRTVNQLRNAMAVGGTA